MGCHRGQQFANGQRNDETHVVGTRYFLVLSDAPQIEEGPTVQRDAAQLDQCDSHREGELVEHHFANDIVAGRDDVPEEAHQQHDGNMTRSSPLAAQHVSNVFADSFSLYVSVSASSVYPCAPASQLVDYFALALLHRVVFKY